MIQSLEYPTEKISRCLNDSILTFDDNSMCRQNCKEKIIEVRMIPIILDVKHF